MSPGRNTGLRGHSYTAHCKAKLARSSSSAGRSSHCQEPSGHGICVLRVSLRSNTTTQLKWAHQRGCTASMVSCKAHSRKPEGKEAVDNWQGP